MNAHTSDNQYCAVIPVFNNAETIGRSIESVLAQTHPPTEIVVVDDGSSDASAEVASRYFPKVLVIKQSNAGPGAARNRGVRETTAGWLAFLDADDTWLPEKMERQMALASDPNVGVIHARGPNSHRPAPPIVTFDDLWSNNCVGLSSAVVRRSAWMEVGGFDESRDLISIEDHNLWFRLTMAGWKIITHPEDLIQYNPTAGSLSLQGDRFVRAIIANYSKIGQSLDPKVVRQKICDVHLQYGRSLVYRRELRHARRILTVPLHEQPSLGTYRLWLTTFVPAWILNLRRGFADFRFRLKSKVRALREE